MEPRSGLTGSLFVLLSACYLQKQSGAEGQGIGSEGLPTKGLLFLLSANHSTSKLPSMQYLLSGNFVCTQAGMAITKILSGPFLPIST